jgi:hypothetical protein
MPLFLVLSKYGLTNHTAANNSNETEDAYFGQKPPEMSAEIFATGIVLVNGRYEFAVLFTPDLEEIYFTGKRKGESSSIYFSKLIDKNGQILKKQI